MRSPPGQPKPETKVSSKKEVVLKALVGDKAAEAMKATTSDQEGTEDLSIFDVNFHEAGAGLFDEPVSALNKGQSRLNEDMRQV